MVLGVERINARRKQPNERINFIKPLKGPDEKYAEDFLERIGAICNPIMKKHRLAVMSLEEYEYNTEFLGRNFNGGEVIQLVLKSRTGNWLPVRFVQMVMMHELAHCMQMNHSKAFWKVKDQYSEELKELWAKGYTGENLWSLGRSLLHGQYVNRELGAGDVLPEHLCGGTYRPSGKGRRAAKPRLSWKEQKERRIRKKFGVAGQTLGADDDIKSELEGRKKTKAKPKVAGSKRGRELRAAAALARFETKPKDEEVKDENDISTDSGSETEAEDNIKTEPGEAHDLDGTTMHDRKGRTLHKVCDDEDKDDVHVKNEMDELFQLQSVPEVEDKPLPEFFASSASKTDSQDKDAYKKRKELMMDFGSDAEVPRSSQSPPKKKSRKGKEKTDDGEPEGMASGIKKRKGGKGSGDFIVPDGPASDAELSEESEYPKRKPKRKLVQRASFSRPEIIEGSETESEYGHSTPKKGRKPTGSFVSPKPKGKEAAEVLAKKHTEGFFGAAARQSKEKENAAPKPAKAQTKGSNDSPGVSYNPPFDIRSQFRPPTAAEPPITVPNDFPTSMQCPSCSVHNDIDAATCMVCGNVLDETQVDGTWKCGREACKESKFVNAGDYARCMVCGERRE